MRCPYCGNEMEWGLRSDTQELAWIKGEINAPRANFEKDI